MKRIFALILVIALVFILAGCGAEKAKKEIFDFVFKNYDLIVEACVAKDAEALLSFGKVEKVNIIDGYVLVYCQGAGIAPSSQDYGFYYSTENSPVFVDCALDIVCKADLSSPEGNGYHCTAGGNSFYTERIEGNFYFYSNAY